MPVDDHWDQFDSFAPMTSSPATGLRPRGALLKPDGAIWVIGSYHNIFRVGALAEPGLLDPQRRVWRKTNPMPNFRGKRLTNAHETMIWASKSEGAKYTFNYEALKALNEGIQMRSDWVLPICNGSERLKDAKGDKAHPTQKPEALLAPGARGRDQSRRRGARPVLRHRHHRRRGPHAGPRLHRHRAGGRLSRDRRGAAETPPLRQVRAGGQPSKRAEPRVPFGQLVERGMLRPGEMLVNSRGQMAKVRADGTLIADQVKGSIHKVGAELEGAPSCNGWTYWHFRRDGQTVPIDVLRQQIRAEMAP
jgi:modification methylase